MTLELPPDIVLGVTHLVVNSELVRLYKCPFCDFKNIHEDEITHHIRYNEDSNHNVDVDKLDKKLFIVTRRKESRYTDKKKEDLPLPWIKCPYCNYRDKVQRDVEWHIIENKKCRNKLYKMKITVGIEQYLIDDSIHIEEVPERLIDPEWTKDPFSWTYDDLEYRLYKAMKLAKRIW